MRKRKKIINFILLVILVFLVSLFSIIVYAVYFKLEVDSIYQYETTKLSTSTEIAQTDGTEEGEDITTVIEDVNKTVVGISKLEKVGGSILNQDSVTKLGLGTGVIISENGYILSNQHVAGNKYSTCYITMEDNQTIEGNVVWADSTIDLAIIKVDKVNLHYINFSDSDQIKVGQNVYAIGNPAGYEFQRSVTGGIISGLNRTIRLESESEKTYMQDLIQTDATINPGNSGGPLIDEKGEMIGINTVKITSAEGIGFAIPINVIKPVVQSFIESDKFEEANLGISGYDGDILRYIEFSDKFEDGVYIETIQKDGPCYNKGIKEGDIITKIDNVQLKTILELRRYIFSKKPGDEVNLELNRNGILLNIKIKLGSKVY